MKKNVLLILALTCSTLTQAQYKKANFFTRNGKFYGFGAGARINGGGSGVAPNVSFIYGKDQGKKHVWHWWDLEYTMGTKYHYSTTDFSTSPKNVDVNGKVSGMLVWRYNWCYYFGDNSNSETKGLPFAKVAVEVLLAGRGLREETVSPANASQRKVTFAGDGNGGLDFGAGYMYHLSDRATFFGVAGYRLMLNDGTNSIAGGEIFYPDPSHPYINVGIRFSKRNEN